MSRFTGRIYSDIYWTLHGPYYRPRRRGANWRSRLLHDEAPAIADGRVRTTLTEGGHLCIASRLLDIDRLTSHHQPAGKARAARLADPDDTLAGLSARNRWAGFVEEVRIDGLLAQVRLLVNDKMLTAVITATLFTR